MKGRGRQEVVGDQNPYGLVAAVASGAGEVGEFVADPIGAFFASGVGWIIEHIPVLKSSLDAVSGDEDAIDALKTTWEEKVAKPLAEVSVAVQRAADATVTGFTGDDATAYRASTAKLAVETDALATAAQSSATAVSFAGAMVIEVRNFIRDELSKLLAWAVAAYAAAVAASVPTAGASVVGATNTILLRGAMLAQKFTRVLQKLTDKLAALAGRLGSLGNAAQALRRASASVDGAVTRAVDGIGSGAVTNTVFRLASEKPTFDVAGAAVDLGIAEIKATGDAWVSARETRPD